MNLMVFVINKLQYFYDFKRQIFFNIENLQRFINIQFN